MRFLRCRTIFRPICQSQGVAGILSTGSRFADEIEGCFNIVGMLREGESNFLPNNSH